MALLAATAVRGETVTSEKGHFVFRDSQGKEQSVPVVTNYYPKKLQYPAGKVQRGIDPSLMRAASIAEERANAHSHSRCWQYVKEALLAAGAVNSYPKTAYAKEAGNELVTSYGFKKLAVRDPFKAPVGSVIVYGASAGGRSRRDPDQGRLRQRLPFEDSVAPSAPRRLRQELNALDKFSKGRGGNSSAAFFFYFLSVAFSLISVPARACEIGQVFLVSAACS